MVTVPRDGESEAELRQRVRLLWAQACLWEGVAPQTNYVVFRPDNPYSAPYDQAYRAWREQRQPKRK